MRPPERGEVAQGFCQTLLSWCQRGGRGSMISCPPRGQRSGHRDVGLFFFSSRRRHTRLSCDWSSDVCSSDLMRRHTRLSCDWSSDVCSSDRSEEHTSELQSHDNLVCRLLLSSEQRRVGERRLLFRFNETEYEIIV